MDRSGTFRVPMGSRLCLLLLGALLTVMLLPSAAQAHICYSTESANMQVHHVKCRTRLRDARAPIHHFRLQVAQAKCLALLGRGQSVPLAWIALPLGNASRPRC